MEKAGKSVTPSARLTLRETVQKLILDDVIDKSGKFS
jgi:hypothetical protein